MNTSVIEAIERQKTTNLYDASKSIPDDEIRELVRLATFSPTAFHLQNWRFIAVRSPEAKARLRAVAADQPKVTEAAVTFIMVGELAVADVMADRLAGSGWAGVLRVWGGAGGLGCGRFHACRDGAGLGSRSKIALLREASDPAR